MVLISGMYRSGSTWSFNVARLLLSMHIGADRVYTEATGSIAETLEKIGRGADVVLLKAHVIDETACAMIRSGQARVIHTYRDPADAIRSGIRAFGLGFEHGIAMMQAAVEIIDLVTRASNGCLIFYDEIAHWPHELIRMVAQFLGIPVSPDAVNEIAESLHREKVRSFTDTLSRYRDAVSAERTLVDVGFSYYDRETFFHRSHVSAPGSEAPPLSPEQLQVVIERLQPHVDEFGRFKHRTSRMLIPG